MLNDIALGYESFYRGKYWLCYMYGFAVLGEQAGFPSFSGESRTDTGAKIRRRAVCRSKGNGSVSTPALCQLEAAS